MRTPLATGITTAAALTLLTTPTHTQTGDINNLKISEVMTFNDTDRADGNAVEIYNPTESSIELTFGGIELRFYNQNGAETLVYNFPSSPTIPAGGYLVVHHPNFDGGLIPAGAQRLPYLDIFEGDELPETGGVALFNLTTDSKIDGLGMTAGIFPTEGCPDSQITTGGLTHQRTPAGADTNNNCLDFDPRNETLGETNPVV